MTSDPLQLKKEILRLTREYSRLVHTAQRPGDDPDRAMFEPGKSPVPYAGRVFDEDEVEAAVASTLDFWLTLGPEGAAFERELAQYLGVRSSLLVNSGSSANLVAFSTLTSSKLPSSRRIHPGDEVITVAAGFPTTVAPIIQCGAVPVFIDANPVTGNADCRGLEQAYVAGKTKAVMMAHALGNPFDLSQVIAFCKRYNLWLIEDNCDALGCSYSMPVQMARELELDHLLKIAEKQSHPRIHIGPSRYHDCQVLTAPTGTWGDLSTQSFYPPHHLTMGEGGAVNIVHQAALKVIAESFRDWGRDCWCASGVDNTCNKRFGWQLGELPEGYDHKYIYSHLGYNLKPLDPQAAIGRKQLKKLPAFVDARKHNWQRLRRGLEPLSEFLEFTLPTHASEWTELGFTWDETGCSTDCSWFGFMLRVKLSAPFGHTDLARHLDRHRIGNRMFFGGNLLRQPAFVELKQGRPSALRSAVEHTGSDEIMNSALFLGTYPGLTESMIDYALNIFVEFSQA